MLLCHECGGDANECNCREKNELRIIKENTKKHEFYQKYYLGYPTEKSYFEKFILFLYCLSRKEYHKIIFISEKYPATQEEYDAAERESEYRYRNDPLFRTFCDHLLKLAKDVIEDGITQEERK